uniref:Protein FAM173B n=1 Tax=Phallusia mammillata TaxID=59560 RepID=A0A6F9DD03_9ASCI|nr:protein FAM173B [Phallusia mammillata]
MSEISDETDENILQPKSRAGLAAFGFVATATAGLFIVSSSFIAPALRKICLPFVPATDVQLKNVVSALKHPTKFGKSVVDIGSGDGRVVITVAKMGFSAVGYELNSWLVLYSKIQAITKGVASHATFKRMDLWKASYTKFDNVVIFGVDELMPNLEKKLIAELKPGSKVIACRFPFPNLPVTATHGKGVDTVWTYIV